MAESFSPQKTIFTSRLGSALTSKRSQMDPALLKSSATSSVSVAEEDTGKDDNSDSTRSLSDPSSKPLSKTKAALTKAGMIAFIVGMCVALPVTLLPQKILYKSRIISEKRQNKWALSTGTFCARWMIRLIPFCQIKVTSEPCSQEPAIWTCNHVSMIDVFLLMAKDHKIRKSKRRPLKIVYWQQLESNPVTKLLFKQCGFIPVQMAANQAGEDNVYDKKSFKSLLKSVKQAFEEGFDIGILPEGQLNPNPEKGLLPVFTGAYTLAKMSKRPIRMMALHGSHRLWHAKHGMTVTGRTVRIRTYPDDWYFESPDHFRETFEQLVGTFGTTGKDRSPVEVRGLMSNSDNN